MRAAYYHGWCGDADRERVVNDALGGRLPHPLRPDALAVGVEFVQANFSEPSLMVKVNYEVQAAEQ